MKKYAALLFFSFYCFGQSPDLDSLASKGYKVYRITKNETLSSLAQRIYKKINYKFQTIEDFEKTLLSWNPHLNKVSNLAGQYIYINNPYPPHLSHKWAPSLLQSEDQTLTEVDYVNIYHGIQEEKKRAPASTTSKTKWVKFIHATVSQGKFLDTIGSNEINSQQNSPFTIGAGVVYLPENFKGYSVASSAYYSNLKANKVTDETNTVENKGLALPAEIGANIYLQKSLQSTINILYAGVDYEQFNTLNFDQIIEGETTKLNSQKQSFVYLTSGLGLSFDLFSPTTMKFSFSQVVSSATEFGGSKYMVYFNQKLTNNFWYHVLYKQHLLSQSGRDVSISRYGLGIGMAF